MFLQFEIEANKVGGVNLLFKLKLTEFHFCKQYRQIFIMDQKIRKNTGIKRPSLFGSRIVGEAFLKSFSIYTCLYQIWTCLLYILKARVQMQIADNNKMSQLMRLWYLSHRRPAKAQAKY